MSNGKFYDFAWHEEYHTVNPKKEKAANCIYLDNNRICYCKDSDNYMEKCFRASYCPHRKKENKFKTNHTNAINSNNTQNKQTGSTYNKAIKCSLPKNARIFHKIYGYGIFIEYDGKTNIIKVRFNDFIKSFNYPNDFIKGVIEAKDINAKKAVQSDISIIK